MPSTRKNGLTADKIHGQTANTVTVPTGKTLAVAGTLTATGTVTLTSPTLTGPTTSGNLTVGAGTHAISVTDNTATVFQIKEASNNLIKIDTTNGSELTTVSTRLSTTDGVASGTVKVVGGRAYNKTTATDAVTAVASNNAHVDFASTYSIPADTLKLGSLAKIRGSVLVTDASGTDTLEIKLYIGGTTLVTTTAFDPDAANDFVSFEFDLVSRAAAGAAAAHVGRGRWVTSDGGTLVHGAAILGSTNLATNGALIVKASAKWSSNTASTSANLETLYVEIL